MNFEQALPSAAGLAIAFHTQFKGPLCKVYSCSYRPNEGYQAEPPQFAFPVIQPSRSVRAANKWQQTQV
jgi:hypothetical protein